MIIALDAGHGGHDPGAISAGFLEKEITLKLVLRIAKAVEASGFSVILTRKDDRYLTMLKRAQIAISSKAALMVSIHANASRAPASGIEAWIRAGDGRSEAIARAILRRIPGYWGRNVRLRGVKPDTASRLGSLGLLRGCYPTVPAVLLEAGFLTHPVDRDMMADPSYAAAMGKAITQSAENKINC